MFADGWVKEKRRYRAQGQIGRRDTYTIHAETLDICQYYDLFTEQGCQPEDSAFKQI